jgi:hypothetical protein
MCKYFVPIITGLIILTTFLFGVFLGIWSIIQTKNVEVTSNGHKMSNIQDACNNADGFSTHKPLSYRINNDGEDLKCGWRMNWSIMRISVACVISVVSFIMGIGLIIRKRWVMIIICIPLLLAIITQIVMTLMDLISVIQSYIWCSSEMPGIKRPPGEYKCTYDMYWLTVAFDACLVVICVITLILTWYYTFKWWYRRYDEPSYEERQSLVRISTAQKRNEQDLDTPRDQGYSPTTYYSATNISEAAYRNSNSMQSNYAI